MRAKNHVKRLAETSPNPETWWDTFPLLYPDWTREAGPRFQALDLFGLQLSGPEAPSFGEQSLLVGATTYFAEAYDEQGIAAEDWATHPALQITATSFSEAMASIEASAVECMDGHDEL